MSCRLGLLLSTCHTARAHRLQRLPCHLSQPSLRPLCRVQFSPDGTCVWALATLPQPEDADSDALPTSKQPDSSGAAGISCLLCFSVADGSLLQQLQQPHGASAVGHFCLDAAGAVLATCGADHLIKLWSVEGAGSAVMPVCQSFTAHHGAVTGAEA